jgi:hypothetical protein
MEQKTIPWHVAFTAIQYFFFSLFRNQHLHIAKNMCGYIHTHTHLTVSGPFLHKMEAVGSADWIFIMGVLA